MSGLPCITRRCRIPSACRDGAVGDVTRLVAPVGRGHLLEFLAARGVELCARFANSGSRSGRTFRTATDPTSAETSGLQATRR
jgi:hypothetical protein